MSECPDIDEVIRQAQAGDLQAFEVLVSHYQRFVKSLVAKHVPAAAVEDVAQNSFVELFRYLATFRAESSFETWLTQITLRRCYDFWRTNRKRLETFQSKPPVGFDNWLECLDSEAAGVRHSEAEQLRFARWALATALAQLSPEDRLIVTLMYFEDRPIKEIAAILGCSETSAKVRAFRVRPKLKRILTGIVESEESE